VGFVGESGGMGRGKRKESGRDKKPSISLQSPINPSPKVQGIEGSSRVFVLT